MKKSTLAIAAALAVCSVPSYAGWATVTFGGLSSLVYTPDTKPAAGRMLFVNLHGCAQKNTDLQKSNWDLVAEKYNAIVVLPTAGSPVLMGCWNYNSITSDMGKLVSGTKAFVADSKYGIDPAQVYMSGISSGATFASAVGCANPDLYAGLGIAAGPTLNSSQNSAMSGGSPSVPSTVTYCKGLGKGKEAHYATQLYAQAYGAEPTVGDGVIGKGWIEPNHKVATQVYGLIGAASYKNDIPATLPTAGRTNTAEAEYYVKDNSNLKRVALIVVPGMGHAWPGGVPKAGAVGSYVSNKFDMGSWMAENFTANNCRIEANKAKSQCGGNGTTSTTGATTTTTSGGIVTITTSTTTSTLPVVGNLTAGSGTWVKETVTHSTNGLTLANAYVYHPKNANPDVKAGKRALMLSLHGCSMSATNVINKGFNWETTAEKYGMVVIAPTVPGQNPYGTRRVGFNTCWDWFGSNHARNTRDESLLIKFVETIIATPEYTIDPRQVYVSGLSAGGGISNSLACVAPDIFAGNGSNAGPVFNTDAAANPGYKNPKSAATIAAECRAAAGGYASALNTQLTSVIHDPNDGLVNFSHSEGTEVGMKALYGANVSVAFTDSIHSSATPRLWGDGTSRADGKPVARVSFIKVANMGHAWPGGAGGSSGGQYVNYTTVNYPEYVTKFFFDNNLRVNGAGFDTTTTTSTTNTTNTTNTTGGSTTSSSQSTVTQTSTTSTTTTTLAQQCWTESANASCATHYVGKRLNLTQYLACGSAIGYIKTLDLYKGAAGWTNKENCGAVGF